MQESTQRRVAAVDGDAGGRRRIATWQLFVAFSILSIVLAWAEQEFVMTREVYQRLLESRLADEQIDAQFDLVRRYAVWGFLTLPLFLLARVAGVALVLQMICLVATREVPFRVLFRAATWGMLAVLYGSAVRILWLVRLGPTAIDRNTLGVSPTSLAGLLLPPSDSTTVVYGLLSLLSIQDAFWIAIVAIGLAATGRFRAWGALLVVAGTWLVLAFIRIALHMFASGLVT